MATDVDSLYRLMPTLYRERDADQGYALRALLRIIAEQAGLLQSDIQQLYEDLFIETCRPWVIPYIGDLVSNNLLFDGSRSQDPYLAGELFTDLIGKDLRPPVAARIRADVAKTIYYRRRKGTLPMLEELARDVTGWAVHAVEFFQLLGWTQNLEHLRPQSRWTDVRSVEAMDRIDAAFDSASHTVDVRPTTRVEGKYNIHNIGFFIWRLSSYPLKKVPARPVPNPGPPSQSWRFHFSPLGNPAPLFTAWRRQGDAAGLATELGIPGPIRRSAFYDDLVRFNAQTPPLPDFTGIYGLFSPIQGINVFECQDCSFYILVNGNPIPPPQISCGRLEPWPIAQPPGNKVSVDVDSGRMVLGATLTTGPATSGPAVDVLFHYGFSADMGGGPYEREKWLIRPELAARQFRVKEDGIAPPGSPPVTHKSLTAALTDWLNAKRPDTIITILDSRNYVLPPSIELSNENFLAIEAANGERPLLQTAAPGFEIKVAAPAILNSPDRRAELTLNGIVLEGFLNVTGDMGRLRLLHSTSIPGRALDGDGKPASNGPSLIVDGSGSKNTQLKVEIAFSITGPLALPEQGSGLWVLDSIVDGLPPGVSGDAIGTATAPGPQTVVQRSTIAGKTHLKSLEASESVFTAVIGTVRTQDGCIRFSYVAPGSRTPRRYHCQPDLAIEVETRKALDINPNLPQAQKDEIRGFIAGYLVPSFTTRLYGRPAYMQLGLACPLEITRGAADGAEMGAFNHIKQSQRESNLRIRLDEYLPFGLEAGIIYVT